MVAKKYLKNMPIVLWKLTCHDLTAVLTRVWLEAAGTDRSPRGHCRHKKLSLDFLHRKGGLNVRLKLASRYL